MKAVLMPYIAQVTGDNGITMTCGISEEMIRATKDYMKLMHGFEEDELSAVTLYMKGWVHGPGLTQEERIAQLPRAMRGDWDDVYRQQLLDEANGVPEGHKGKYHGQPEHAVRGWTPK